LKNLSITFFFVWLNFFLSFIIGDINRALFLDIDFNGFKNELVFDIDCGRDLDLDLDLDLDFDFERDLEFELDFNLFLDIGSNRIDLLNPSLFMGL
jgi:hypothetical protein